MHGNHDPLFPPAHGIDTAKCIPDAKLELIDGWGHDLPEGLMPRFAQLLDEHAESASRAA